MLQCMYHQIVNVINKTGNKGGGNEEETDWNMDNIEGTE